MAAYLLLRLKLDKDHPENLPVVHGVNIYSEPSPTCLSGERYLHLRTYETYRPFHEAREALLDQLRADPADQWILPLLNPNRKPRKPALAKRGSSPEENP